jgi:O-antigen ligase
MPENIRALIIIIFLSTITFASVHQSACIISQTKDFTRRRNLWFGLTIAAFLTYSFWLYALIAILLLVYTYRQESNVPALFFFVLFALPIATVYIPGGGLINYLFAISHARILALVILLPTFFKLIRQNDTLSFGRTGSDKILATYLLLTAILYLRGTGISETLQGEASITETLRQSFYLLIDIFIPYFVISRSLKDLQAFRDALLSLVIAIMVLAPIAILEAYKQWLLYQPLNSTLELGGMTHYLGRDGMLRAIASAGHPIALGYLMVVGVGFYLFLQHSFQKKFFRRFGMALLAAGLIAPLSRGPWIGALVLLLVFISTGRKRVSRLLSFSLVSILALFLISLLPVGERVINLLPFIGSTEKGNVDYRENLITNSMIVIKRNPWLGSANYIETPEMEAIREGQGIIDVVNTYIGITLEQGLVGLGLFVGFFALVVIDIYRSMRMIPDRNSEEYLLGRSLLATILAILVIIVTVSSITIIPIVYWSVAALGVAYAQMVKKQNAR